MGRGRYCVAQKKSIYITHHTTDVVVGGGVRKGSGSRNFALWVTLLRRNTPYTKQRSQLSRLHIQLRVRRLVCRSRACVSGEKNTQSKNVSF